MPRTLRRRLIAVTAAVVTGAALVLVGPATTAAQAEVTPGCAWTGTASTEYQHHSSDSTYETTSDITERISYTIPEGASADCEASYTHFYYQSALDVDSNACSGTGSGYAHWLWEGDGGGQGTAQSTDVLAAQDGTGWGQFYGYDGGDLPLKLTFETQDGCTGEITTSVTEDSRNSDLVVAPSGECTEPLHTVSADVQSFAGSCAVGVSEAGGITYTWNFRRTVCDDSIDSDGGTISDCEEFIAGTNASDPADDDDDVDNDGVKNRSDNCPQNANAGQADLDGDGAGDVCDADDDGDGLSDTDESEVGTDSRDPDSDDDGFEDGPDKCPLIVGTNQGCPPGDSDFDTVPDDDDNCLIVANTSQEDADQDGIGDACEVIVAVDDTRTISYTPGLAQKPQVTFQLIGNDIGDGLEIHELSAPSEGTLTAGATIGSVALQLPERSDYVGTVTFTYRVQDDYGHISNAATVTLHYRTCAIHHERVAAENRDGNPVVRLDGDVRVCGDGRGSDLSSSVTSISTKMPSLKYLALEKGIAAIVGKLTGGRATFTWDWGWEQLASKGDKVLRGKFRECMRVEIALKNFDPPAFQKVFDAVYTVARKYLGKKWAERVADFVRDSFKIGEPIRFNCDTLMSLRSETAAKTGGYKLDIATQGGVGIPFAPSDPHLRVDSKKRSLLTSDVFRLTCPYYVDPASPTVRYGPGGGAPQCELLPKD
jgi:hypothetical protein